MDASNLPVALGPKLEAYRRNEVSEYIVWRVLENALDWFVLRNGQYRNLTPGADGHLKSDAFPGLWLDSAALLRGDLMQVHRVVLEGIRSPEHAAFVARLQQLP